LSRRTAPPSWLRLGAERNVYVETQSVRRLSGPCGLGDTANLSSMLTDEEAAEIRKLLDAGWRGPILLRWLEQLLQDRDERRRAADMAV
jgi:hypothetical protein